MTAINEQGQVYWTFEELDLVGVYKAVNAELVAFRLVRNSVEKNNRTLYISDEFDWIFKRITLLSSVLSSIGKLMTITEFVDGGCHLV